MLQHGRISSWRMIWNFFPCSCLGNSLKPILFHLWPREIYLWRKFCLFVLFCFVLFCLYFWDPPNRDASDCVLGLFGKLSRRRGASPWFHGIWTCNVEVLEYWMIFSLKISEELTCAFGVLGKILMSRI